MLRPCLLAAVLAPFALVACGEKASPEPITPVVIAAPSSEPASSAAPASSAKAATADDKTDDKPKKGDATKKDTDDAVSAKGAMWGDAIGDSFGSGGLGLSGVGPGGGGTGEGIGLGGLGTLGHGAGTGTGQGFGSGRIGGTPGTSPSLRQGATSVSGRLPPEVIQRIVRQNFGRFRLCYENGLRTNPKLAGTVVARYTIDRSGATIDVKDAGSTLPEAAVVQCVLRGFGNLSYPQPEGGIVTVTYPIQFDPGQATPPAGSASAAPARSAAPASSAKPKP